MVPSRKGILLYVIPIEIYEEIRNDIIDIYQEAYEQIPDKHLDIISRSPDELREKVNRRAREAKNYDPHQSLTHSIDLLNGIWVVVTTALLILFLIGFTSGLPGLLWLSRRSLSQIVSPSGVLIGAITGGGLFFGVIAAVLLISIRIILLNTFVVQTLNSELVISPDKLKTRNKSELAGYLIWNSSLNGGKALHLLSVFAFLWMLSLLPFWRLYEPIREYTKENIDVFIAVDSRKEAVRVIFQRMMESEDEDEEEE